MRDRLAERIGPELMAACKIELIVWGEPVEAPGRGCAVRRHGRRDPRPRPGRRPAAVHGPLRHGRQAHRPSRRPDVRLLAAAARGRRAASRPLPRRRRARLRSRRCAGACPSSTTSSAASAVEPRDHRGRLVRPAGPSASDPARPSHRRPTRTACLTVGPDDRRRASRSLGAARSVRSGSTSAGMAVARARTPDEPSE